MPSSRGTKRKERNVLRRERPDVRRRISKEPDSFPSINPTSSSCIGYTVARLLRTLTPLGIIDIVQVGLWKVISALGRVMPKRHPTLFPTASKNANSVQLGQGES